MQTHLYGDLVTNFSRRFKEELSSIETEYNFDLGTELEVCVCRLLRKILPQRYGVCRGFVVNQEGKTAGDDIIIYDQMRFPAFRLLTGDLSRKNKIPVEAVFAYLEIKNTLRIGGDGPTSYKKSMEQVAAVKNLCNQRPAVPLGGLSPYVELSYGLGIEPLPNWPDRANPMYAAIIARNVAQGDRSSVIPDPAEIIKLCQGKRASLIDGPDFMMLGENVIGLPVSTYDVESKKAIFASPFVTDQTSKMLLRSVNGIGFGVFWACLCYALDWSTLGKMPWSNIIIGGAKEL